MVEAGSALAAMTVPANPWSLTQREAESLDAMLARGTFKGAAKVLGIEESTVIEHIRNARRKMQAPHKLGHFLMWHDWRKASQPIRCRCDAAMA